MTLLLNFITGIAWIVGSAAAGTILLMVSGFAIRELGNKHAELLEIIAYAFRWGVLPWAWLIARYCL